MIFSTTVFICGYCLDKEATIKRFFDICSFYELKSKDLAKLLKVSNTTLSYWRNGSRFPGWDKIMLFAYTVGLPLDIMIIGKKSIANPQIKTVVEKINYLKEKKYITILQELLDNGKLDKLPLVCENVFNPLGNNTATLDYRSTQYAKLCADVKYYGLKKQKK